MKLRHIWFTWRAWILFFDTRSKLKWHNGITIKASCLSIGSWWRHQMEVFSALLAICAGNSPVSGEFPAQRPVTRSFDVFFDLCLNERLSKQSWGWWFETTSRSLWRHCNVCDKSQHPPYIVTHSIARLFPLTKNSYSSIEFRSWVCDYISIKYHVK